MSSLMSGISPFGKCSPKTADPAFSMNIFPLDKEGTLVASQSPLKRTTTLSGLRSPWVASGYPNIFFSLNTW